MTWSAGARLALLATAAVMGATCDSPSGPRPVVSVQVTPRTWTFTAIGDTVRFAAVTRDAHALGILRKQSFTWSASAPSVVFMLDDGLALAIGPGVAQVRASTEDSVTGSADVNVVQTIESVIILLFDARLRALGDSLMVYVEARDRNSHRVGGTAFSFRSLNENVVTVTPAGWAKAVSPGVASIVATAVGKADTTLVQVLQDVETIALSPDTAVVEDGATRQFIATLRDHNGYPVTDRVPAWSTSDSLVMSVNTGSATARAIKLGHAKVIATSGGARGEAPVYVFTPFVSAVAGPAQTCAISSHGRSYCWGWINYTTGQRSLVPLAQATTPALASSVGAGVTLACGLTAGGAAYCWGDPPFGVSGAAIASAFSFSSSAVGYVTAYGLTASGDVYSLTPSLSSLVPGGLSFTTISASAYACGTVTSGAAYCWGSNITGGLGDSTYTDRPEPTAVAGGHTFTFVAAGGGHTCGITTSGPTYCWGRNNYGSFGDNTTTNTTVPVPAAGGLTLTSVTAGDWHTCGLVSSGAAYCWGFGERGSIGNGMFDAARLTPAAVSGDLTFASISAGGQHTCALTGVGALFCWGRNEDGEVGDGTGTNRSVPTRVTGSRP